MKIPAAGSTPCLSRHQTGGTSPRFGVPYLCRRDWPTTLTLIISNNNRWRHIRANCSYHLHHVGTTSGCRRCPSFMWHPSYSYCDSFLMNAMTSTPLCKFVDTAQANRRRFRWRICNNLPLKARTGTGRASQLPFVAKRIVPKLGSSALVLSVCLHNVLSHRSSSCCSSAAA